MRRLQVRPALHDPFRCNAPNHDSAKFQTLPRLRVRRRPVVSHDYFVVFGDKVFDLDVQIGKALQHGANVLEWRRLGPAVCRAARPHRDPRSWRRN